MRILIIDDEANIRKTTGMMLTSMGHEHAEANDGENARKQLQKQNFDVALLDLKLGQESGLALLPELFKIEPRLSVIVFTAFASFDTAVEAIKIGAFDYVPKPFTPDQIREVFRKLEKNNRLESRVAALESQLSATAPLASFQTTEPAMQRVCDMASKVASTPASVLITGESGTGKSVLARALHHQSDRKENAFVTVNCPSLSRELLESELFGHMKGAFTGAVGETYGKVAAAQGGTLFLDEIGELPLEIQPRLLRLLQEKEYERVGDPKVRRADVRVIAATNRKLEEAVKNGSFREDLFYRLNVITLEMLPLRQRMGDLRTMIDNHLQFFSAQIGKKVMSFSPAALKALQGYSWPGNLRELRNVVERSVILAANSQIELSELPDSLHKVSAPAFAQIGALVSLEQMEKEHIERVLAQTPSLEKTAEILGIDTATLYRKRKKLGLE